MVVKNRAFVEMAVLALKIPGRLFLVEYLMFLSVILYAGNIEDFGLKGFCMNKLLKMTLGALLFAAPVLGFSARELALENLRMSPPSESVAASWSEDDEADAVFGEPPMFSDYERMRYGRMDYNSANWSW